jgi:hypothetical protein
VVITVALLVKTLLPLLHSSSIYCWPMLQSRLAGCCLGHFNANLFAAFAHRACRAYVCVVTALAPPLIISYPHMWIASCVRTCSSLDAFDWSRWVALTNRTIEADLISTSLHFAASARSYCISLLFDLRPIARLHSSPPPAHQETILHLYGM